jgi:hypothetical protein
LPSELDGRQLIGACNHHVRSSGSHQMVGDLDDCNGRIAGMMAMATQRTIPPTPQRSNRRRTPAAGWRAVQRCAPTDQAHDTEATMFSAAPAY